MYQKRWEGKALFGIRTCREKKGILMKDGGNG